MTPNAPQLNPSGGFFFKNKSGKTVFAGQKGAGKPGEEADPLAAGPAALGLNPRQRTGLVRPVAEEAQSARGLGRLTLDTDESGRIDPNLVEAYRRHLATTGHALGEFTVNPRTRLATAPVTHGNGGNSITLPGAGGTPGQAAKFPSKAFVKPAAQPATAALSTAPVAPGATPTKETWDQRVARVKGEGERAHQLYRENLAQQAKRPMGTQPREKGHDSGGIFRRLPDGRTIFIPGHKVRQGKPVSPVTPATPTASAAPPEAPLVEAAKAAKAERKTKLESMADAAIAHATAHPSDDPSGVVAAVAAQSAARGEDVEHRPVAAAEPVKAAVQPKAPTPAAPARPAGAKPEPQAGKGDKAPTKAALERHMLDAWERDTGASQAEFEDEKALQDFHAPFTFHDKLPGEVKDFLQGRAHLKRLFTTTQDASKAQGADAMEKLGQDRYFALAERGRASRVGQAVEHARNSPDPELKLAASIYDTMPERGERGKVENVHPEKLNLDDAGTINGLPVKVTVDADGNKILTDGGDLPETPIDALTKPLPFDKGSLHHQEPELPAAKATAPAPAAQPNAKTPEQALRGMTRASPIPGMGGQAMPDPVAQEILRSPHAKDILDAIPHGSTPLTGGAASVVLNHPNGKDVVRVGPTADRPNIPEVLQPTQRKDAGGYMVETLPRVETKGITDADVETMGRQLKAKGYELTDPGTDNLGRTPDGRLVVIDAGAVAKSKAPAPAPTDSSDFELVDPHTGRLTDAGLRNRSEHADFLAKHPLPGVVPGTKLTEAQIRREQYEHRASKADSRARSREVNAKADGRTMQQRQQRTREILRKNPGMPYRQAWERSLTMSRDTEHKFSSTQVNLRGIDAERVLKLANEIPDAELAEDGRETDPHVTLKYGLHADDVGPVQAALAGEPPIRLRLGKVSIFPASKDRPSDVVKVDVDSPDLYRLNKKVADAVSHTDTYPTYTPHLTLGYVKPGMGKKYEGRDDLAGRFMVIDRVRFSGKDGCCTDVRLTGKTQMSRTMQGQGFFFRNAQGKTVFASAHSQSGLFGGQPAIPAAALADAPKPAATESLPFLRGAPHEVAQAMDRRAAVLPKMEAWVASLEASGHPKAKVLRGQLEMLKRSREARHWLQPAGQDSPAYDPHGIGAAQREDRARYGIPFSRDGGGGHFITKGGRKVFIGGESHGGAGEAATIPAMAVHPDASEVLFDPPARELAQAVRRHGDHRIAIMHPKEGGPVVLAGAASHHIHTGLFGKFGQYSRQTISAYVRKGENGGNPTIHVAPEDRNSLDQVPLVKSWGFNVEHDEDWDRFKRHEMSRDAGQGYFFTNQHGQRVFASGQKQSGLFDAPAAAIPTEALHDFAAHVQRLGDEHPVGLGDNKVYLSHIAAKSGMEPEAFKAKVKEAAHAGLLKVSRADLPLDPKEEAASEVNLDPGAAAHAAGGNATAHYLLVKSNWNRQPIAALAPKAPVDTNRQLGLQGQGEIGERAGQADLFPRGKAPAGESKPAGNPTDAKIAKQYKPEATPTFDTLKQPRSALTPDEQGQRERLLAKAKEAETRAAEPKPVESPKPMPTSHLEEHQQFVSKLRNGEVSAAEVHAHYQHVTVNAEAIKSELTKRTKVDLAKMSGPFVRPNEPKESLVRHAYHQMQDQHHVGDSYSYSHGERDSALEAAVAKQTDEHIKAYAGKVAEARAEFGAKLAAHKKALANPETLAEFHAFAKHKGEQNLTPEQRAKYDDLRATKTRGDRLAAEAARGAVVGKVAGAADIGMEIKEHFHTKRGHNVHIVTMADRVGGDTFKEMAQKARMLGGNYSRSFHGSPAGFQFDKREHAERFVSLQKGDVDRSEDMAARQANEQAATVERMKGTADAVVARSEEELNRDRLTNTARRAGMAAGIEARARSEKAKANTLANIAERITTGDTKFLGGIKAMTHVDELDRVLNRAKYDRVRAKDLNYSDREAELAKPPSVEDVDHAEYPYPKLWSGELLKHAKAMSEIPGLKNIGTRLAKKAKGDGPQFKTQGNGFKFHNGQYLTAEHLKEHGLHGMHILAPEGKAVRVHASYDWRLAEESSKQGGPRTGPFYTADAGKSFSHSPQHAVLAATKKGTAMDVVDMPKQEDQLHTFSDPHDIESLTTAAFRLKGHSNPDLRSIGERLHGQIESHRRLQAMEIRSPHELRAALREYVPIRSKPENEDPVKVKERALIGRDIPGFFPTPRPTIDRMLEAADIQPGHKVLEPSAGKGDILDAIRERHPDAEAHGIEPVHELRDIVQAKGHTLVGHDVMGHTGEYDRVVMNPPFENGQDRAHVRKAYDLLKPGGKMVAVMAGGSTFHGEQAQHREFRDWLDSVGGHAEDLPEGSFAGRDAFRQTGVNTKMVVIHKHGGTQMSRGAFARTADGRLRFSAASAA